ncbi:MAG: hypothetical protein ACKVWR_19490 [Acidimicrobiales bacterium]
MQEALWAARRSRDRAYEARRAQQQILGKDVRAGRCGRAMGGDVTADSYSGKRLLGGGYESCGWLGCAVCGRSIRARRALEIMTSAKRWEERGNSLVMLTLAPPHHRGSLMGESYERLRAVWAACSRRSTLGRRWHEKWKIRHHWISWEATAGGEHGDHPHLHALLYVEGQVDAETVADDLLARLHTWAQAHNPGRAERMALLDGWTGAGVQAVEAGAGAATYLAKLTDGLTEDELAELRGLGLELTDVGAAKQARAGVAVPTTAIAAVVAERARQGGMRARYWLAHDPYAAELAQALRTWRKLTHGRPLLASSRGLRADLLPDFADLTDEQLAAEQVVWWDRRKLAELERQAAGPQPPDTPTEPRPDPADQANDDDEMTLPFTVAAPILDAWAATDDLEDAYGGTGAALCRLLERVGVWRAAHVLAAAWARTGGRPLVTERPSNGRVRVAAHTADLTDHEQPVTDLDARCSWPDTRAA